jgi:hypothetical protein
MASNMTLRPPSSAPMKAPYQNNPFHHCAADVLRKITLLDQLLSATSPVSNMGTKKASS